MPGSRLRGVDTTATVLPRAAGCDEGGADRRVAQPAHDLDGSKLRAVVGTHERRLSVSRINRDNVRDYR